MIPFLLDIWGCIPELSKNCIDMTNAGSTYIGIVAGAIIGGIVSWWIYNRQKNTTEKQDHILGKIKELEESHGDILRKLEDFDNKHESSFNAIQELNGKIDSLLKKSEDDLSK
jgi:peptidoglycan hydrolase CwlO-like protein